MFATRFYHTLKHVTHLILPNQCLLCQQEILYKHTKAISRRICSECQNNLNALQIQNACTICALPLKVSNHKHTICGECLKTPPAFNTTRTLYEYGHPLDYLINQLKQQNKPAIGLELGKLWAEAFACTLFTHDKPDIITCVPIHTTRLIQRHYNQADLIAKSILKHVTVSPLNYQPYLFKKTVATTSQQTLSRKARVKNLKGSFTLTHNIKNLHIAIIDDVLTTGATAQTLALMLKQHGAAHVDIWTIARTPKSV